MRITLARHAFTPFGTVGELDVDGVIFYTIERPWLDNKPFDSCIPPGVYRCNRYSSTKYPDTFEVCDVPERSKILIHVANTAKDVQGCIGLGTEWMDKRIGVAHSRNAIDQFMRLMRDEQSFDLMVTQFHPEYP